MMPHRDMFPNRIDHIREQLTKRAHDLHWARDAHEKAELREAETAVLLGRCATEVERTALRVEIAHQAWDALYDELRQAEAAEAERMVTS